MKETRQKVGIKKWQGNPVKKLDFESWLFLSDPSELLNAFSFLLELMECISHINNYFFMNFHVNIGTSEQQ